MDLPVAAGIDEHRGIALQGERAFSGEAATQPALSRSKGSGRARTRL